MPLFSFDHSILDGFSPASRTLLETMLFTQAGVLSDQQADELASLLSISVDDLPDHLLPVAAACAQVPVSNFNVGVVLRGGSGALYLGANLEFEDTFLGLSLHGEQSALNNAWLHGETSVSALVVNAAPCGLCRQFLHELDCSDKLNVKVLTPAGETTKAPLSHYLPDAFGPADLGIKGGILSAGAQTFSCNAGDELTVLALEAAKNSYAPYTGGYAGVAIETADGVKVAGRYACNAAHNPSLQPFTSAFSQLRFASLGKEVELKRMVLVEASSKLQHISHVKALQHIFPNMQMDIVKAA